VRGKKAAARSGAARSRVKFRGNIARPLADAHGSVRSHDREGVLSSKYATEFTPMIANRGGDRRREACPA
jgi:hypothetical protein